MKFKVLISIMCAFVIYALVSQATETGATPDTVAETKESAVNDTAKAPVTLPGNAIKKKASAVQTPAPGEIKPLPDGKTIADIYTDSDQLKNKVVSLNARVIKIKKALMGKNWITLQDGTGSKPDNKLVATSQEAVKPGDLVIVKGTLATNVDLGRGYSYKVMLEEATFSPGLE